MISQIDLKELLDKIIELHFDNYKFTQKGSLEWYPIHDQYFTFSVYFSYPYHRDKSYPLTGDKRFNKTDEPNV